MKHEVIMEIEDEDFHKYGLDGCREIIRCKDCRHRIADDDFTRGHICMLRRENGGRYCEDYDYCSYAERKPTHENGRNN